MCVRQPNRFQECVLIIKSPLVWVDQKESFYCALDKCTFDMEIKSKTNISHYECERINCSCIPDRMLCGADGSIDLTDFLIMEIHGPATFSCTSYEGSRAEDDICYFS